MVLQVLVNQEKKSLVLTGTTTASNLAEHKSSVVPKAGGQNDGQVMVPSRRIFVTNRKAWEYLANNIAKWIARGCP